MSGQEKRERKMATHKKEKPRDWWWFSPITGLEITDETADLTNPIFENATIISADSLKQHFKGGDFKQPELILHHLNGRLKRGKQDAWVGVKRLLLPDKAAIEADLAMARFRIITAALSILCLQESKLRYSCCPTDEVSHRISDFIATDAQRERYVYEWKIPHIITFARAHWKLDRAELKRLISNSPLVSSISIATGFAEIRVDNSVSLSVASSLRRLANSLCSNQPGEMVLASWSVFEILLSSGDVSFEKVLRRSIALTKSIEIDEIKELYELRNKWVHRGQEPPLEAVREYLKCSLKLLASFSDLVLEAPNDTNKKTLLEWLDLNAFVNSGQPPGRLAILHRHFSEKDPLAIKR